MSAEIVSDTIIIGAGPSGLAAAACLRRGGVPFTMLEAGESVGWSWHHHYDRLHLHTVKQYSSLPHFAFPAHFPVYPSRQQVVDYLEAYADHFGIVPRFGELAGGARFADGWWSLRTPRGPYRSRRLIVATGYNRRPKHPSWPGVDDFVGEICHSRDYRNAKAYRGKSVLVVGIGNTGGEIAIDGWEHGAKVLLCVRNPVHVVPRDVWGIPAQLNGLLMSRLPPAWADRLMRPLVERLVGDLSPWGLHRPTIGPVSQVMELGRVPLIDVGTIDLIKQGAITVVPGIDRFSKETVHFVDGREERVDAVILATGYAADLHEVIDAAPDLVDSRGYPRWHGEEAAIPGLYFIGFRNPINGALNDIAREARRIATDISGRQRVGKD